MSHLQSSTYQPLEGLMRHLQILLRAPGMEWCKPSLRRALIAQITASKQLHCKQTKN